jgi:hemoglobin
MDRPVISDATAWGIAWAWSGYGSEQLVLDRFVATGEIDHRITDQVAANLHLLRAALAVDVPPAGSAAEAAMSVSTAQLAALHIYLEHQGPRGPQPQWRLHPRIDWRDATDPFGTSHNTRERDRTVPATPADYVYQQLGGPEQGPANVAAVVDRLYKLILGDPELDGYFDGIDMRRLKAHMRSFIVAAVGGPDQYQGRPLRAAHAHLGVTDEHFNLVVSHLVRALSEFHVPADVVEQITGKLAPLRADVVAADATRDRR